jgi:hypothetical protein
VNQHAAQGCKRLSLKILSGLGALVSLIVLIALIPSGCFFFYLSSTSAVSLFNQSGANVRFERVTIDDQIIWDRSEIAIKTSTGANRSGGSILREFSAPRKKLELKLVTVNESNEREIVSCTLDNNQRPCFFTVYYFKGRLECGHCQNYLD